MGLFGKESGVGVGYELRREDKGEVNGGRLGVNGLEGAAMGP